MESPANRNSFGNEDILPASKTSIIPKYGSGRLKFLPGQQRIPRSTSIPCRHGRNFPILEVIQVAGRGIPNRNQTPRRSEPGQMTGPRERPFITCGQTPPYKTGAQPRWQAKKYPVRQLVARFLAHRRIPGPAPLPLQPPGWVQAIH